MGAALLRLLPLGRGDGNGSHVLGVWEERTQGILVGDLGFWNIGGGHHLTELWEEAGVEI